METLREIGDRHFEGKRKVDVRAPRLLCLRRRRKRKVDVRVYSQLGFRRRKET